MALQSYLTQTRFDPRRIPGLHSWWDASDSASVTLDAGRVSQLSDKSGNARHLTNTTSGSTQPSYVTGGRNGLNVARFAAASVQRLTVASSTATYKFLHDGTQCWYVIVSSYGTSSDPSTYYVVFATNNGSNQVGMNFQFNDLPADGQNNGIDLQVANGSSYAVAGYNSGFPASLKNIVTPQATTIQDVLLDVGNATATNRAALKINGGNDIKFNTFSNSPSSANAGQNFTFGSVAGGSYPLTGDLCELMLFNSQPTAAARDQIRRYLGAKWGVAVA